jgi:hypothetical protein
MASKVGRLIWLPLLWLRSKFTHKTYCPKCAACWSLGCCGKRCKGGLSCADYSDWHERDGVPSKVMPDCCPPRLELFLRKTKLRTAS